MKADSTNFSRTAIVILIAIFCSLMFLRIPVNAQGIEEKVEKDHRAEVEIGVAPPDFSATDMEGNAFKLSEMAGEKPVVLDFWATWCGPCRMELPLLNEFYGKYADEVAVVAITSEAPESAEAITKFIADNKYVMRVIHDSDGSIAKLFPHRGIPFLVVVDEEGTVIATHLGYSEGVIGELEKELGLATEEIEEANETGNETGNDTDNDTDEGDNDSED